MALIDVSKLSIQLQTHRGPARAVRDVSFSIPASRAPGIRKSGASIKLYAGGKARPHTPTTGKLCNSNHTGSR